MLWVNLGLVSPTLTLVIELAAFWRPLVERGHALSDRLPRAGLRGNTRLPA